MNDRTRKPINGVGILFHTRSTGRTLFLLRNQREQVWGIPGGKVERGETLLMALERECREEIGYWPEGEKLYPVECYTSSDGKFCYHTFFCVIPDEIVVSLNNEHLAYAWVNENILPRPLHGGLYNTLSHDTVRQKINIIRDNLK